MYRVQSLYMWLRSARNGIRITLCAYNCTLQNKRSKQIELTEKKPISYLDLSP